MLLFQVGMGSMDHYERYFEEVLLNDSSHRTCILHHFVTQLLLCVCHYVILYVMFAGGHGQHGPLRVRL
jgi:hypothetical protein